MKANIIEHSAKEKSFIYKTKEFLTNYWFWLCGFLALISLITGFIGFSIALESKGTVGVFDYLYYALQLFTFESLPEVSEENLYLKFSKLSAPTSVALFSARAIYILFLNQLLLLRLKRYKNHVVIFGLGHMGMIFLRHRFTEGKKIVVILKEDEKINADNLLELRIPVLYGDASEDIVLDRARISHASEIYILTDNDILNASVVNKVLKALVKSVHHCACISKTDDKLTSNELSKLKTPKLTCSVHINDYEFKRSIEKEDWVRRGVENINLMIFNVYEMVARHVVKDILLEPEGESVLTVENPRVLIIGFGQMGQALLRQLIRMKVYPGDKRLRITIFYSNAKRHEEIFLSMYYDPNDRTKFIFRNVELFFVEKDLDKIHSIHDLFERVTERLPQVIYICTEDDALTNIITYKIKLSLEELYKKEQIAKETKIVAFFRNTIFGSCKEDDMECITKDESIKVHNINIVDKGCHSFIDLSEIDKVAKMIHADFFIKTFISYLKEKSTSEFEKLKEELDKILDNQDMSIFEKESKIRVKFSALVEQWIKDKPSREKWQFFDEDYKNSNRLQADHLIDKLKVLNPKFSLDTDPKEVENALRQGNNIEILAELEYKRYCAEKHILLNKTNFKEYKDLEEREKEWNRAIVSSIPNILLNYQEEKKKREKEKQR